MSRTSYKSYLMNSTDSGTTWTKLIDVKDIPALGGEPNMVDITTLSDSQERKLQGVQKSDAMTFTANYDATEYQALLTHVDKAEQYAVWFGTDSTGKPDGSDGKFTWTGTLSVYVDALKVDGSGDVKITISKETAVVPSFVAQA